MSAFGGKADIQFCGCLLSRSLLGVKRTWFCAPHMSAYDPTRTSEPTYSELGYAFHPRIANGVFQGEHLNFVLGAPAGMVG